MEFTPLLAVELLAAFVALLASFFAKRLFRSMALYQKVKKYPGEQLTGVQSQQQLACGHLGPLFPPSCFWEHLAYLPGTVYPAEHVQLSGII